MADTTFIPFQTIITSDWLNDVDRVIYRWQLDPGMTVATGTVPMPIEVKVSEICNVMDFGAVEGNSYDEPGSATNVTAFQNALNYQALSGALIYIPAGQFWLNGPLTYKTFPRLSGAGQLATQIYLQTPGAAISPDPGFNEANGSLSIEKLSLITDNAQGAIGFLWAETNGMQLTNGVFRDCYFLGWNTAAIKLQGSANVLFENIYIEGDYMDEPQNYGIMLDTGSTPVNGVASQNNTYNNIRIDDCYRGIGVTVNTQLIDSTFLNILGMGCDGLIETYWDSGALPDKGGNCTFINVTATTNTGGDGAYTPAFGIKYYSGTEIECDFSTPGCAPVRGGNFAAIDGGRVLLGNDGNTSGVPAISNTGSGSIGIDLRQATYAQGNTAPPSSAQGAALWLADGQRIDWSTNGIDGYGYYDLASDQLILGKHVHVDGNLSIGGNLSVAGNADIAGNLAVGGNITAGGTITDGNGNVLGADTGGGDTGGGTTTPSNGTWYGPWTINGVSVFLLALPAIQLSIGVPGDAQLAAGAVTGSNNMYAVFQNPPLDTSTLPPAGSPAPSGLLDPMPPEAAGSGGGGG